MRWRHLATVPDTHSDRLDLILDTILKNRGLADPDQIDAYLHPSSPFDLTFEQVGINSESVKSAVTRIHSAINKSEPVIIFGDYDADGITATAILWEALHSLGLKVMPFIPHREKHGYGLSLAGIKDALAGTKPSSDQKPLFITVDNGIVAFEAAEYLKKRGLDLIITDHHEKSAKLPTHHSLIHTTTLSGAGVSWMLAKELHPQSAQNTLELATIGTVADMLPLVGPNRQLVKAGLKKLSATNRSGLKALFVEAGIDPLAELSTYHINFIIAPRLNAMGRLKDALTSLRLLCTKSASQAKSIAAELGTTNSSRQDLTHELVVQARDRIGETIEKLIVISGENFHEGIIGLVAGKLVETYYRPAIVISQGKDVSKASARSIPGVNIIDLIRQHSSFLLNAGGHPMAAGFSLPTANIDSFTAAIQATASQIIENHLLVKELAIDAEINFSDITPELFQALESLKPFGIGNPKPVFSLTAVNAFKPMLVGKTKAHLKVSFQNEFGQFLNAIGFNLAPKHSLLQSNKPANIAFTIEENSWNGRTSLQLQLKDIIQA